MSVSVPSEKLDKVRIQAQSILNRTPSIREVSSFLGRLVSLKSGFPYAPLYYRNLQFQFSKTVKPETNWDNTLNLNSDSLTDIFWWSSCSFPLIPYSIKPFNEDFILHTDASYSGWGGQLSSVSATSGTWSDEESSQHINYLELKAVLLCVQSFISELRGSSLKIYSDNTTTVFYINKLGGTHSKVLCFASYRTMALLVEA